MQYKKFFACIVGLWVSVFPCMVQAEECQMFYAKVFDDPSRAVKTWPHSKLYQAFNSALQCHLVLKVYDSEKTLRDDLGKGNIDFAFLKDFSFYLAKKKHPNIRPIAVALTRQYPNGVLSPYYSGYLLALKSSGIQSVDDLKNKKIGFLSYTSTSGFILPYLYLKSSNIPVSPDQANISFYENNDDKLFQAMLSNQVDVIATWDDVILRNPHSNIRVIKKFENIPNPSLILIKPLSPDKVKRLQSALTHMGFSNTKSPTKGYALPENGMYDKLFVQFDAYCKSLPAYCH